MNNTFRVILKDSKRDTLATYTSNFIPKVGEIIDCNHGNFTVVSVWHDIRGNSKTEEGFQTEVRLIVFNNG